MLAPFSGHKNGWFYEHPERGCTVFRSEHGGSSSSSSLYSPEIPVIGEVGVTTEHELVINNCVRKFCVRHNIHPKTYHIDVSVLTPAAIAVSDKVSCRRRIPFEVGENTGTHFL